MDSASGNDLSARLLATGDALLAEASPINSFSGIGKNGKGTNMLGRRLMEVRKELRRAREEWSTSHHGPRGDSLTAQFRGEPLRRRPARSLDSRYREFGEGATTASGRPSSASS